MSASCTSSFPRSVVGKQTTDQTAAARRNILREISLPGDENVLSNLSKRLRREVEKMSKEVAERKIICKCVFIKGKNTHAYFWNDLMHQND